MKWEDFETAVLEHGQLQPRRCNGDIHWQILGPDGRKVDFWPTAKGGPKYRLVGTGKKPAKRGGLEKAIEEAYPDGSLVPSRAPRFSPSSIEMKDKRDCPEWWEDRARIINAAMELMDAKSRDLARLSLVAVLVSLIALGVSAAAFIEAIVEKG